MIYPAWYDLIGDDEVVDHPTALRLYVRLLRAHPLIFVKPHHVKADFWAGELKTHRDRISSALRVLIARGYVTETGRTTNNVREVMFAIERVDVVGCHPNEAASRSA